MTFRHRRASPRFGVLGCNTTFIVEALPNQNGTRGGNIRGERSVTCRGDFDRHPSLGPLPEGAPAVCEIFRL